MTPYLWHQGECPLLVSIPHAGTEIPPEISAQLINPVDALQDTDWFVDKLYSFARQLGASVLVATMSRVVVDLNRPPDQAPLYPDQAHETTICPTRQFDGSSLYPANKMPKQAQLADRLRLYWQPYHRQLAAALDRLGRQHGWAVLVDAHSIRSRVPRLFDGELPHLSIGTAGGQSAAEALQAELVAWLHNSPWSWVLNGRFQGGYITRRYGDPANDIHAIQLEIAQRSYLREADFPRWDDARAAPLQAQLATLLQTISEGGWRYRQKESK